VQVIRTPEESRTIAHVPGLMFKCGDCGQVKPVQVNGGTGYATGPTDKPNALICYDCCAIRERADMTAKGVAVLYFTRDDSGCRTIGNWPGTLRFPVTTFRSFRHPFSSEAYLGEFIGPDGALWRFRNIGDNQIAHCRRAAGRTVAPQTYATTI